MPANLTPDYLAAERDYKSAQTHQEKIAALEKMLSTVPKHKGTEKLQADIKRRLSHARKESQKKGVTRAVPFYLVKKEGAGQVVLIGPPNSGKSQLVCSLTHARPEVADYPFTTRTTTPGMMAYEDVQIQLVDLPPISAAYMEPWIPQVIRGASLGILVVDLNAPALLDDLEFIVAILAQRNLPLPRLILGNKVDLEGAEESLVVLQGLYGNRFQFLPVSATTGQGLDRFARAVFDLLEIVRVYTKAPGKKPDLDTPYILRRGQTVQDAARLVHKDFGEHLRFVRLYSTSGNVDGLMVDRTHVVEDRDVLELHL